MNTQMNTRKTFNAWVLRNATLRSGDDTCGDLQWSYMAQAWMMPEAADEADSLCCTEEDFTSDYAYYETALRQVDEAIRETGVAVVTDDDFVELLEELGYSVVPCIEFDEYNWPNEWFEIFPTPEAEEEFYDNCNRAVVKNFSRLWRQDEGTGELVLWENDIHAFISEDLNNGGYQVTISVHGWYSYPIVGFNTEEAAMSIVRPIWERSTEYTWRDKNVSGGVLIHRLDEMPFDRYEDGKGFIHATGFEYLEADGTWMVEYEDDLE